MKKEKLNEENKIDEAEKTSSDAVKKEKPAKVKKSAQCLKRCVYKKV